MINTGVVLVHVTGKCVGSTHSSCCGFVIQTLSPCVNGDQRNGAGPFFQFDIAGVVTGVAIPLTVEETERRRDIREWSSGGSRAVSTRGIASRKGITGCRIGGWQPFSHVCPLPIFPPLFSTLLYLPFP